MASGPDSVLLPETFWMAATLVLRPLNEIGAVTTMEPASCSVELPALLSRMLIAVRLVPALAEPSCTTPSFTVVLPLSMFSVPESGFAPVRYRLPQPDLVKPFVPASGAEMMTLLLLASVGVKPTMMEGDVAEPVSSVSALPPLAASVHTCEPVMS